MPDRPAAGFVATGASAAGEGALTGAGGESGWRRSRRGRRAIVRSHPVLTVGDLIGPGRSVDERIDPYRKGVVLAVLDDRRQILHAKLRCLLAAEPGGGLNCPAQEGDRIGEVVQPEHPGDRAVGRLIDVGEVLQRVGHHVQGLLDVVEAVNERLRERRQPVRRGAQGLAVVSDESGHVLHGDIEVLHRVRNLVGIVGQQRRHRGEIGIELRHQIGAVMKGRNQSRQVLDGGKDVGAVIAEGGYRLGQLDDRVTDLGTLSAQIIGGGVDGGAQRADVTGMRRLQAFCEFLQLLAEVVELHRHRGATLRDHRSVGQGRAPGIGRGQLHGARCDQLRGHDDRVDVRGHPVFGVDGEGDFSPLRLGLDRVDPPHLHAEDDDIVAGIYRVAVVEVGDDGDLVDPRLGPRQRGAAAQQHEHQRDSQHTPGPTRGHRPCPSGTSLGAIGVGVAGGPGSGGPGGGPPGGGAGNGGRYG